MDRKFWYAPGQKGSPWQIAGTDKAEEGLYMDETAPYTGRHTPVLKSDGKRIALKQTQLGLRPGISCSGYIVMKADRRNAGKSDVELRFVYSGIILGGRDYLS